MKKVLIATHIKFWNQYSGDSSRLQALIEFLNCRVELTVAYGGNVTDEDLRTIVILKKGLRLELLGSKTEIPEYIGLFSAFMAGRYFDVCIIEHVLLSFLAPVVPDHSRLMLDTHDIASDRSKSFKKMDENTTMMDISEEQELQYYRAFDHVILIQQNDYNKISRILGKDKTILAPHPVVAEQQEIRRSVKTIGFVASAYSPNVDSVNWFINHVWSRIRKLGVSLDIYGTVYRGMDLDHLDGVNIKGVVPDLSQIYKTIDIVINPVRFGAGLKIKNVEAMGNGLPLVTTTHGASGIIDGEWTDCLLVADDPELFYRHLNLLIESYDRRKSLGDNAYRLTRTKFSPEQCFNELFARINEPVE
ncbi:MAG TPA: glycosyltransferase family 4 protein [Puia sp.]